MSELLYDSCKIWEACRATSAATTFFDPIEIGSYGQKFAYEAIADNNPIQLVYREAETLWPQRVREAVLISIGTGSAPSPALDRNLLSVVKVLKDIVVQTESTADDFFSDHLHMTDRDLLYIFNVYHGLVEIGLEEYKERRRIADATHTYLTAGETRQRRRKCIQKLGYKVEAGQS
jgi:predicted acylesterase/phospholipase RssA